MTSIAVTAEIRDLPAFNSASSEPQPGRLVASILAGSWRPSPPKLESSDEELASVSAALLKSGAGSLAWWRIRNHEPAGETAAQLRQAYLLHTIHAERYALDLRDSVQLLRDNGIDPVVVKGWVSARLYPEAGLRPYGDLDLCVRPDQFASAKALLAGPEGRAYPVDLHNGFSEFGDNGFETLFGRSRQLALESIFVRVLSDEDHLRYLALHLLRHGAYRPIWLCDVAAAVEAADSGFDWDRALGSNRRLADWTISVIALARELLGAEAAGAPLVVTKKRLPGWLIQNVVDKWAEPIPSRQGEHRHQRPMASYLRNPRGLLGDLRNRWPDPLAATIEVNGSINWFPRLPFQFAHAVQRTGGFFRGARARSTQG
jgi:hypothetical protein